MARGRPTRVEPLIVFILTLALVLVFIIVLIGAWDVPTPVCETKITLPHEAFEGLDAREPLEPPKPHCF